MMRLRSMIPAVMAGLVLAAAPARAGAADYYVAPGGDDGWTGGPAEPDAASGRGPFRTLGKAVAALQSGDTLHLRRGVYREVLRPVHSGQPGKPIVIRNYRDEKAVLSGADAVGEWRKEPDGTWSAAMPWTLGDRNQVLADGNMLEEARWPNSGGSLMAPARARAEKGQIVKFRTAAAQTEAVVVLGKDSDGPGWAWFDNVGLPRTPRPDPTARSTRE